MKAVRALILGVLFFWGCGGSGSGVTVEDIVLLDTGADAAMDTGVDTAPDTVALLDSLVEVGLDLEGDDVGHEPGEVGAECEKDGDCASGICIQTSEGRRCSTT